ncbi:MAG: metal-sensing transcriptional repressor [Aristaeellaceae bacterium]
MAEHDHEYLHAHGIAHSHDGEGHDHQHDGEGHEHSHGHSHTHTHENTRAVLNRLSRAIGHLQSVKRMVEEGRDCSEVLIQIAAVRSAIDNTGKLILQDHLKHCIIDAAREGDQQAIDDLCQAIDKYMK